MKLWHGTSTNVIEPYTQGALLPPSETWILREDFRKKHLDKVFATGSRASAEKYAKKACEKFGGKPLLLTVSIGEGAFFRNGIEYAADSMDILKEEIL